VLIGLVDDLAVRVAEDAAGRDVDDLGDSRSLRAALSTFSVPATFALPHRRVLFDGDPTLYIAGGVTTASQPSMPGAARRRHEVAVDEPEPQLGQLGRFPRVADKADDNRRRVRAAGARPCRR
jgi:hypothetical protein